MNTLTAFPASRPRLWRRWCARLERPGYFMQRCHYPFRFAALAGFPIQRWTWRGP